MLIGKMDYVSRMQTLLVFLILNDTAKTKLAILAIVLLRDHEKLCCTSVSVRSVIYIKDQLTNAIPGNLGDPIFNSRYFLFVFSMRTFLLVRLGFSGFRIEPN